jgi:hypothetical protein
MIWSLSSFKFNKFGSFFPWKTFVLVQIWQHFVKEGIFYFVKKTKSLKVVMKVSVCVCKGGGDRNDFQVSHACFVGLDNFD